MTRDEILADIKHERNMQDAMWGTDFDDANTANDWVAYITRYVAEGAYDGSIHKYSPINFRNSLMKAAAICIAAMEAIYRNGDCAPRHYD